MPTPQDMIDAVKRGDLARVTSLLDVDPMLVNAHSDTGDSAVLIGLYYGQRSIVDLLRARGASLNIFEAAAVGDAIRVAELLRESPGLVRSFSHDGWTALHLAAFFGSVAAAHALLAVGSDTGAWSRNGMHNQPLHAAVAGNHDEVVDLLITGGADVNTTYEQRTSPLHVAAQNGNALIARALLEAGASVNARQSDGKTPLAVASEAGHTEVTLVLNELGGVL